MSWIAGWNKRIKLTISGSCIEGDLSNFPVLVHLDSTCSGVFNELGSNSKRISVVAPDMQQCYVEVEDWNESTNSANLWVKVPTLSSGVSSDIYLYYDNLRPDNSAYVGTVGETSAQNVWDSNFVGVWHMNQDPSIGGACIKDSTSNGNNGTPGGSMTSGDLVDGKVGKALDFDAVDDHINVGALNTLNNLTGVTWEAAVKNNIDTADRVIVGRWGTDSQFQLWMDAGNDVWQGIVGDGTNQIMVQPGLIAPSSSYQYIVMVLNGQNLNLYIDSVNGGSANNASFTTLKSTAANNVYIGADQDNDHNFNDAIDEVRISNIARSAPWIKVTYYSNWNQLINYGNEETVSSGFLPGWNNRLKLTIQSDYVDNTLTDFPVMIKLSEDSGYNSYDNRSVFYELETDINRKKIAITDSTGILQCFVEIERFSCEETDAVLWTRLPVVYASIGTHFYLYYDKTVADNTSFVGDVNSISAKNVWDSNFVGVWHMNQDPTGGVSCIKDSTSNGNHGTPGGSMTSGDLVDGKVGKALDFDGSDDIVKYSGQTFGVDAGFTLEGIIKVLSGETGSQYIVVNQRSGDTTFANILWLEGSGSDLYLSCTVVTTVNARQATYQVDVSRNNFFQASAVYKGDQKAPIIYINAIDVGTYAADGSGTDLTDDTGYICIGGRSYDNNRNFDGIEDEIRISNIARSAPWIKATYYSNWDDLVIYEKEDITTSWLDDWSKRIKLTIDHTKIDSSLVDFPVLVTLASGIQSDFFSEMSSSDRKKIAVTKNNGTTQCPVEIEQWDFTNGKVNLWTKIPIVVFDIDTDIYLYYDSSKNDNTLYVGDVGSTPAKNVWDSNFVGVWHMNQDPTEGAGCIKDSTSNINNGTPGGSMTSGDLVDGKVGKALDFDSVDDYVNVGSDSTLDDINQKTLEIIFKADTFGEGTYGRLFDKDKFIFHIDGALSVNKLSFNQGFSTTTGAWAIPNSSISLDVIYNVALVYDNSSTLNDPLFYIDGTSQVVTKVVSPVGLASSDASDSLYIGNNASQSRTFDGILDEIRFSNVIRSASWIKATYYSNWNTVLTYGSVQNYSLPPDYYYHGYVKEKGTAAARRLYLYKRDTGTLMDSCMSNASTGYYLLETTVSGEHFIVALDDVAGADYNALVQDRLYPNDII